MANPTITVTPEPENVPPRVRINITDTGTPAVLAVNVTRMDAAGQSVPVRTADGNAFVLTASGSDRVGTLYDYEVPLGQVVTYKITENAAASATTQLDSDRVWLIHPGVPSRSLAVRCWPGSFDSVKRAVNQGVFYPMGREHPVVMTDGRRKAPESTLVIRTSSIPEIERVIALVADAQILMLNVPPSKGWGIGREYVAVGDISQDRRVRYGSDTTRTWTLPILAVGRPAGGSQAQWSLADVMTSNATLADVKAKYATLADLQANTPVGS